uniref:Uncharacterized protein n=1 Tax=Opuntia streptacantha TaxID=393608 RepID=A0A7C9CWC9_OPUST
MKLEVRIFTTKYSRCCGVTNRCLEVDNGSSVFRRWMIIQGANYPSIKFNGYFPSIEQEQPSFFAITLCSALRSFEICCRLLVSSILICYAWLHSCRVKTAGRNLKP